jgi:hypothetical protein
MPISAAFSTCSGLAADLRAGDRRVLLVEHADRARGQQEAHHALVVRASDEGAVIVQYRGDDPGRAVGRGGHDAAACGVLLVDRHRIEGHPLHRVGGARALCPQRACGDCRPTSDLETAGQDALTRQAALHAVVHHAPDLEQPVVDLRVGTPGALVLQHQRRDRQAGLAGEVEQFLSGTEGVAQDRVVGNDAVRSDGVFVHDESAADRVVRLLQERYPGHVVRAERHAVGVVGQRAFAVHDQLVRLVERDLVRAAQLVAE